MQKDIYLITLALFISFSLIGVQGEEFKEHNRLIGRVVLNTILDGYYSTFTSAVWLHQEKYIVYKVCHKQVTKSVEQQFQNIVTKLQDNVYFIPMFLFDPEFNYNEKPQETDLVFKIDRKHATGLAFQLTFERLNPQNQEWVDNLLPLTENIPQITNSIGQDDIESLIKVSEQIEKLNVCEQVQIAKQDL